MVSETMHWQGLTELQLWVMQDPEGTRRGCGFSESTVSLMNEPMASPFPVRCFSQDAPHKHIGRTGEAGIGSREWRSMSDRWGDIHNLLGQVPQCSTTVKFANFRVNSSMLQWGSREVFISSMMLATSKVCMRSSVSQTHRKHLSLPSIACVPIS